MGVKVNAIEGDGWICIVAGAVVSGSWSWRWSDVMVDGASWYILLEKVSQCGLFFLLLSALVLRRRTSFPFCGFG